jgi:hypothetical protein
MQRYSSTFITTWLKGEVTSFSGIIIGISASIGTVDIGMLQRAQGGIEYRLDSLRLNPQIGAHFERT